MFGTFGQVVSFEELDYNDYPLDIRPEVTKEAGVKLLLFEGESQFVLGEEVYEAFPLMIFEEQAEYLQIGDIVEIKALVVENPVYGPSSFRISGRILGRENIPDQYDIRRDVIPPVPKNNPPTDEEIILWNRYVSENIAEGRGDIMDDEEFIRLMCEMEDETPQTPIDFEWTKEGF